MTSADIQKQRRTFILGTAFPFYSQAISNPSDDLEGFASEGDALLWQQRGCGIASLRMVIDGYRLEDGKGRGPSYGELTYRGLAAGAYCHRGWIHEGLVKLAALNGLRGYAFRSASMGDIIAELDQERVCIASVSVCFRGGEIGVDGRRIPPGGHLVVVLGYVEAGGQLDGFIVNHPSSSMPLNWERQLVKADAFGPSFSGAFMSFEKGGER